MATILEFKIAPRLFAGRLGNADHRADILFFPGIRYERQTVAAPEPEDPAPNNGATLKLEN